MSGYDALLVVSFGGPEGPDDVMPFLENVVRGRDVPRERLLAVAEHYRARGGKSPINDQNRALIAALGDELQRRGQPLPIYFGNRNWHPLLPDALRQMRDDGVKNALALIVSAYSSYSGCRQYRENIEDARAAVPGAPAVTPLRRFFNHPGFLEAWRERLRDALQTLPLGRLERASIVYTAHSIPSRMAGSCRYETELRENARWLSEELGYTDWTLAWQSRSGPPTVPWLEPDVLQVLRDLRARDVEDVVLAPIGFVSDHMEVVHDLDVEAQEVSNELGLRMLRVPCVGMHPRFVQGLCELVAERTRGAEPQKLGRLPLVTSPCAVDCCPPPTRG